MARKEILIAGGTGLIGTSLIDKLVENYDIVILTRHPELYLPKEGITYQKWEDDNLCQLVEGKYAVVNLIGENIGAKRWTTNQQNKILRTRVDSATKIAEAIVACAHPPQVVLQASAVGYYPNHGNGDELQNYKPTDFLSSVCQQTERAINTASHVCRVVVIRTGIVLAVNADIWKQITMPFRFGVAPILGNGRQTIPWIHIEDEVSAIVFLLENGNSQGPYNLCAPNPVSWGTIISTIRKQKTISIPFYIPAIVLRLIFGKEKAEELMLKDQPCQPIKLKRDGFQFKYNQVNQAIIDLLKTK